MLAAFFVSSSLVSRVPSRTLSITDAKSNRRDGWQVLANGGPAALAALLEPFDAPLRIWLVTASLAAAASDTWATAVGARSRMAPRLLWSRRPVPPGTSGGVTVAGCLGGALGAAMVAATGALVTGRPALLPAGTLIGFLGMLADSAAGGALQGKFFCPRCHQPSEWPRHRCGASTEWTAGWVWLNNDGVNLLTTALAAGLAGATWWWLD